MADPTEMGAERDDEPPFEATDAIARTWSTAVKTGIAGFFFASVQTTMARRQIGAIGVFTTFGGTVGWAGKDNTSR